METIALTGKALSIANSVGTGLIIRTLTSTTSSICYVLGNLTSHEQPGIKEVISEVASLDLEHIVSVIEALVGEYDETSVPTSVKKALCGVNKILEDIHEELNVIRETVEYHKSKLFSGWRGCDCKQNIELIKKHKEISNNRYKILIELLMIKKK